MLGVMGPEISETLGFRPPMPSPTFPRSSCPLPPLPLPPPLPSPLRLARLLRLSANHEARLLSVSLLSSANPCMHHSPMLPVYNAISHPIEDAFFQNTPKLKTYPRFRLAFRLRPFVPALNTPGRRYTDVFARPGSAPYTRTECTLHMRT